MKVLVTGHHGYIGSVVAPLVAEAGHEVVGLDTFFYRGCDFGADLARVDERRIDVRDVTPADLAGFDAVVHLAALSNDPLGDLNASWTYDVNYEGTMHLARVAKEAGVSRFVFSSSCSMYGASGRDDGLDEDAPLRPLTPYAESKVRSEEGLVELADSGFSPVSLRNATAYGVSPRLRADIVVNNLVGVACTTGEIVVESDGTPWRPLVHVEDIARAFLAVLEAPRQAVHNEAFNVGGTSENYQIRDLVRIVEEVVPGCTVRYREGGGPDPRCYRVNCDKISRHVPAFRTEWTVRRGVEQLYQSFTRYGLTRETFAGYVRLARIKELLNDGRLDASMRWRPVGAVAV